MTGSRTSKDENLTQKVYIPARTVSLIAEELALDVQTLAGLFKISSSEADKWKTYGIKNRNKVDDFKNLAFLHRLAKKGDGLFSIEDLKDMIELIVRYPWLAKDKAISLGFSVNVDGCSGLMELAVVTLFARSRGIDVKWRCEIDEDFEKMNHELYGRS